MAQPVLRLIVFGIFFLLFFSFHPLAGQNALASDSPSGMIIAPTRLVFSGRDRSKIVRLINPDNTPVRYRLSLINIEMDEFGTRRETNNPHEMELMAKNMVRFSPRQVTIPPDGWQTIRLMLKKPKNLTDGEYRVHLKVVTIPASDENKHESNEADIMNNNIGIQIKVLMNVTIPIIIRHGKGGVGAAVNRLALKNVAPTKPALEVEIERFGNHSLFADLIASIKQEESDAKKVIGRIPGIAVYTPNSIQKVLLPIDPLFSGQLTGKNIEVDILDRERQKYPLWQGSFSLTENVDLN